MKKIFLLIVGVFLFGAKLINVNFFPHKNFIDVLISLDSKFNGKIIKIDQHSYKITNVYANKEFIKKFEKGYLEKIKIIPQKNDIILYINNSKDSKISFSLTPEGYGIRVRVSAPVKDEINALLAQNTQKSIDYVTYFIILAILVILAIILWIVRKKVPKLPAKTKKELSMGVIIQKPIDAKNKIVLFEFNKRKYLMLIGNTNILLDVFDENMANVTSVKEFDEFLEINNKVDEIKKYIRNAEELKEFDERI